MVTAVAALPFALYRAAQVRALDACAMERFGIPAETLMERAGAALWRVIQRQWPQVRRLCILAGPGNNGGDGYVLARLARAEGVQVHLLRLGDPGQRESPAARAAQAYCAAGGVVSDWPEWPRDTELIVDALLGTGLRREVTGVMREAIGRANASRCPVLAVDIPSGLCADTGAVLGAAMRASVTLSFIGLKQGLFTGEGPEHTGRVLFDGLEVPPALYATQVAAARRIHWQQQRARIAPRQRSAHKGNCGHLLVVGGTPGMSGAARLCGEAALRAGAGLVTLATHPDHAALLNLSRPELMVAAVSEPQDLARLLARARVVALGPGLGVAAWGQALFAALLADQETRGYPLVIDADGLNLLAQQPRRSDAWVLTPHPGEAARLLGCPSAEIARDRFAAVAALQRRYGGVVVLKGAGTLIQGPGPQGPALCSQGNPGMASAGMGDALTGILGALLAQGLEMEQAASAAVCLHAAAGDQAARGGERGLLASDLIAALPGQWLADDGTKTADHET